MVSCQNICNKLAVAGSVYMIKLNIEEITASVNVCNLFFPNLQNYCIFIGRKYNKKEKRKYVGYDH